MLKFLFLNFYLLNNNLYNKIIILFYFINHLYKDDKKELLYFICLLEKFKLWIIKIKKKIWTKNFNFLLYINK